MTKIPVADTLQKAVPFALRYSEMLNSVFSGLAFASGLASVSTEAPKLYATLSFGFILLLWNSYRKPYIRHLRMLNVAKHSSMSTWSVILRNPAFFYGWLFLGLVALGALDKSGWHGLF